MLGDAELVQGVLADFRTSKLADADKALFAFLEKVNFTASQIRQPDVDALKAHGWSDEAIYDAITVCALFNFYNRWNDAAGTPDMPAFAYEMSGKRMAENGYYQSSESGESGESEEARTLKTRQTR